MNLLEKQLLEWGYEAGSPIDISIRKGERKGKQKTLNVLKLHRAGLSVTEIAAKSGASEQEVQEIIENFFADEDL